jgi:hypothetical protein
MGPDGELNVVDPDYDEEEGELEEDEDDEGRAPK